MADQARSANQKLARFYWSKSFVLVPLLTGYINTLALTEAVKNMIWWMPLLFIPGALLAALWAASFKAGKKAVKEGRMTWPEKSARDQMPR